MYSINDQSSFCGRNEFVKRNFLSLDKIFTTKMLLNTSCARNAETIKTILHDVISCSSILKFCQGSRAVNVHRGSIRHRIHLPIQVGIHHPTYRRPIQVDTLADGPPMDVKRATASAESKNRAARNYTIKN
uniref:Glycine-rich protein n=1 Tax=Parascaris univalens TaxID=6257 RepID=A0A915CIQ2_PARUN